jgi:hypothetical protein
VWAVKQHTPVRIAEYRISGKDNINHFQAEALIGDRWVPLSEFWNGRNIVVRQWVKHFSDKPVLRYLTVQEAEAL